MWKWNIINRHLQVACWLDLCHWIETLPKNRLCFPTLPPTSILEGIFLHTSITLILDYFDIIKFVHPNDMSTISSLAKSKQNFNTLPTTMTLAPYWPPSFICLLCVCMLACNVNVSLTPNTYAQTPNLIYLLRYLSNSYMLTHVDLLNIPSKIHLPQVWNWHTFPKFGMVISPYFVWCHGFLLVYFFHPLLLFRFKYLQNTFQHLYIRFT